MLISLFLELLQNLFPKNSFYIEFFNQNNCSFSGFFEPTGDNDRDIEFIKNLNQKYLVTFKEG